MSENRLEAIRKLRNGTIPNRGNYWTEEELGMLEHMYVVELADISDLALFFGRNELSICQQLLKLGLMERQIIPRGPRIPSPICQCFKCIVHGCPNRREPYAAANT